VTYSHTRSAIHVKTAYIETVKQYWLDGHHWLLLKDFGPYVIMFMNVRVIIIVAVVWWSFAVKGFGPL
jgi:hypothetical protein